MINVPKSESSLTVSISTKRADALTDGLEYTNGIGGRQVFDLGSVKLVRDGEYTALFGAEPDVLALLDN